MGNLVISAYASSETYPVGTVIFIVVFAMLTSRYSAWIDSMPRRYTRRAILEIERLSLAAMISSSVRSASDKRIGIGFLTQFHVANVSEAHVVLVS